MDVKERLKNLDPLLKMSLSNECALIFYNKIKYRVYIKNKILPILKSIYEPLGMWGQKPGEDEVQEGIINQGFWDPLMQGDTHYTGWSWMFNRCNKYLLSLYREKGIESIVIDGVTFSYKEQIRFEPTDTFEVFTEKIDKIFKIIEHKKYEIFLLGNPFCEQLRTEYRRTMSIGDEAQSFYLSDINYFFNDLKTYVASTGRGDLKDMKEGVDVWKTHNDGRKTTDQIKSTSNIKRLKEGFLINTGMSEKCKADYYVFVSGKEKIMVFKNDKTKIVFTEDGVFFPIELLYKEKDYNLK
jgi:hypothetical protein